MKAAKKVKKVKKIDQVVEIYKEFLPKKEGMKKRAFRAIVVEAMRTRLDMTVPGTIGCYYAWAEQLVTGRSAKQYNITAPRRKRGAPVADQGAEEALTKMAAAMPRASADVGTSFGVAAL